MRRRWRKTLIAIILTIAMVFTGVPTGWVKSVGAVKTAQAEEKPEEGNYIVFKCAEEFTLSCGPYSGNPGWYSDIPTNNYILLKLPIP